MKILFVASEAAPFAKVGGLGEVMYSLPRAICRAGHDARVFMPKYAVIDSNKFKMEDAESEINIPSGSDNLISCNIKYLKKSDDPDSPVDTYFLENKEYYEKRSNVYGYGDDAIRWALLCRGVLEFVRAHEKWRPDIIVAADWQGGLIPNYMHNEYKNDSVISKIAVVFSIHNLSYQGMFDHHFVSEMDHDDGQSNIPGFFDERMSKINFMRRGVMYADVINTVSPNYAKEITTSEYGELLDNLLSERRSRLFGILNGIDYMAHNPATDSFIGVQYGLETIKDRYKNKDILRQKFNLPDDKDKFIIGIVSRFTEQKGFDLLVDSVDALLSNFDVQIVILGAGDGRYINFFNELDKKYRDVATHLSYDEILPRIIYAGADAILIPSKFEPCGLTQMEAMRYGSIPIVRKTGGLADSVDDYDPRVSDYGTGFVFEKFDHYALFGTIIRAMESYKHSDKWMEIQKRAMAADFSWDHSAREYIKLFEDATKFHLKMDK